LGTKGNGMNYIKKLQAENRALKDAMEGLLEETINLQRYYLSDKFSAPGEDYAHVSTDVYPRITAIKSAIQSTLNQNT